MSNSIYQNSFNKFLSSTDEKKVIANQINKYIDLSKISSVLDIGAGRGDLLDEIKKENSKISVLCVENNEEFIPYLQAKDYEYINESWEDVKLDRHFDLIIAAYVITYFPRKRIEELVSKMLDRLNENGSLFIVTVDESRGSWRKVHEDFYSEVGLKKNSSTIEVENVVGKYGARKIEFTTTVSADSVEEMIDILEFDLYKFGDDFYSNKDKVADFLSCYSTEDGVKLEIVNKAFLLSR